MDVRQTETRCGRADVDEFADKIRGAVADRQLAEVIVRRVALMAADGRISRSQLDHVLTHIAEGRRAKTIKKPGAYFVACARTWLQKRASHGRRPASRDCRSFVHSFVRSAGRKGRPRPWGERGVARVIHS